VTFVLLSVQLASSNEMCSGRLYYVDGKYYKKRILFGVEY